MLKHKPHRRSAIPINRVITQGDISICGICRKIYKESKQANVCLTRCLSGHLNPSDPVVALSEAGAKKFRCHFCRRVFSERNKAVECASACKVKTNAVVASEHPKDIAQPKLQAQTLVRPQQKSTQPDRPLVKPAKKPPVVRRDQMHKFFRDGRKLVCKKCGSEKMTLDDVIACYDSHPEHVKKTPQEKKIEAEQKSAPKLKIVKATAPEIEKVAKTPRLTNEDEKFLRDGARYVCRHCGKKLFTREDVFACYDSHAGEQPAAKVAATAAPAAEPAPVPEKTAKLSSIEDDHKFFRDGARYICRTCSKKHFTRGDVTTCFDAHGQPPA